MKYRTSLLPPEPPLPNIKPQRPGNTSGLPAAFAELTFQRAGGGIVRSDLAIAQVADEKIIAEGSEVGSRQRQSPGSVQRALVDEPLDEVAIEVEDVDKAETRARHCVSLGGVLFPVSHEELIVDKADIVRSISGR